MENVVRLTYRATHSYLIEAGAGWLLVDPGWPGSLAALRSQLRAYRLAPASIRWLLITHTHPDHAGLTQALKQATGARLLIHPSQVARLPELAMFLRSKGEGEPIRVEAGDLVLGADTRPALASLGLAGEVVATPGHSDDSVSLVLDSGPAFVGDLHLPAFAPDEAAARLWRACWQTLLDRGAQVFYPAHGEAFEAEAARAALAG
jgi:glyoxylase-like metal-dependent hydrolase (beta-lactamase superfamily II)